MALRSPPQLGNSSERRQKASRAVREPREMEKPSLALLRSGCQMGAQETLGLELRQPHLDQRFSSVVHHAPTIEALSCSVEM